MVNAGKYNLTERSPYVVSAPPVGRTPKFLPGPPIESTSIATFTGPSPVAPELEGVGLAVTGYQLPYLFIPILGYY